MPPCGAKCSGGRAAVQGLLACAAPLTPLTAALCPPHPPPCFLPPAAKTQQRRSRAEAPEGAKRSGAGSEATLLKRVPPLK